MKTKLLKCIDCEFISFETNLINDACPKCKGQDFITLKKVNRYSNSGYTDRLFKEGSQEY